MESVKKLEALNVEEVMDTKYQDEALVVFNLKNHSKIAYVIDIITLRDVRRRLQGGIIGVLKIGQSNDNKIDLNQVANVMINAKPFEA